LPILAITIDQHGDLKHFTIQILQFFAKKGRVDPIILNLPKMQMQLFENHPALQLLFCKNTF
jgi:hypothetical protein